MDFNEDGDTCVFCEGHDTPPDLEVIEPPVELPPPSASTSSRNGCSGAESPPKAKKKQTEVFDPFKQLTSVPSAEIQVEGISLI